MKTGPLVKMTDTLNRETSPKHTQYKNLISLAGLKHVMAFQH